MSFTRQQRHAKTQMVGRSFMRMGAVQPDPPRCKSYCEQCGLPAEKLNAVGPRFLCDDCKSKEPAE